MNDLPHNHSDGGLLKMKRYFNWKPHFREHFGGYNSSNKESACLDTLNSELLSPYICFWFQIWEGEMKNMINFKLRLKNELKNGLPGTEVQWQMASSDRMVRRLSKSAREGCPHCGSSDSSLSIFRFSLYSFYATS